MPTLKKPLCLVLLLCVMLLCFVEIVNAQVVLQGRSIEMRNCSDGLATSDKGCAGKKAIARWSPPRFREDGVKLPEKEIDGYTLTYSQGDTVYVHQIDSPRRAYARLLTPGTWVVSITARDVYGLESAPATLNITVP